MGKIVKISIVIFFFSIVLVSVGSVWAENNSNNSSVDKFKKQVKTSDAKNSSSSARKNKEFALTTNPNKTASPGGMRKSKLSEARLNICRGKQNLIANRIRTIMTIGSNRHNKLEGIVMRVDKYYTEKLVPEGFTLSNYESLKTDIAAKQTAVEDILAEAQASGQAFSCDSEDPKSDADGFRQDVQALITANKAYKTAVRNFVAAVRDLAKQAHAPKLSPVLSPPTAVVTEAPEE